MVIIYNTEGGKSVILLSVFDKFEIKYRKMQQLAEKIFISGWFFWHPCRQVDSGFCAAFRPVSSA